MPTQRIRSQPGQRLLGKFSPVGDKSISHRSLLLNALAQGAARVEGLNRGADLASTRTCLRQLGVTIRDLGDDSFELRGRAGRFRPATSALDCGNSGTTARLLAGIVAGQAFTTTLDGDESLRRRPMARIARPLRAHGARVEGPDNGAHLPLIVTGPLRQGGRFESPVASAQLKSAMLLAALCSGQTLELTEPSPSRDHTERLLAAMGATIEYGPGWARLGQTTALDCVDLRVPGDPSAAAFFLGAAILVAGSEVVAESTLINPTRTGFVEVLRRMGGCIQAENVRHSGGEEVADLRASFADGLVATTVADTEVPSLLDEIPLLAVVAAFAEGATVFEGVGELRVKESDRLAEIQRMLDHWAIGSDVSGDRLVVHGGRPRATGDRFESGVDHRIAMAASVLSLASVSKSGDAALTDVDITAAVISDPDFAPTLEGLLHGS